MVLFIDSKIIFENLEKRKEDNMDNNIYTYDAKLNEIVTPKKDLVFKRIFGKKGNEAILKDFLEAILEISRNEIKIPIQYQYVDDAFRKLLNVGATINQIEVIRNFNGWSWNISSNMRNYEYNIIYQTLNYIVGYDLLYEFIDNNNITLDYIKILNEQVVLKMRKQNRKRI